MTDIRTIGISFNASGAKRGANEAKKAIREMTDEAKKGLTELEKKSDAAGSSVSDSGRKIEASTNKAGTSINKLGSQRGFQRMAANAKSSTSSMRSGLFDLLDTFGVLDTKIGRFVRRANSGYSALERMGSAMGNASRSGGTAASVLNKAGGAMNGLGLGAGRAAGGLGGASALMGSLGTAAAVALPILVAVGVALGAIGAAAGVFKLFTSGAPLAGEIERADIALTALTGSGQEAERILKSMRDEATRSGVQITEQAKSIQKFIALGFASDDALKLNRNILDVAGAVGMSAEEAKLLASALAQVQSKGVVSMEELRQQIAEKGIPVIEELQKKVGLTGEAFFKAVSNGQIPAKELIDIFLNMEGSFGRFAGGAEKMADSWGGQLQRVKTQWELLRSDFAAPITTALKPALEALIDLIIQLQPIAKAFGETLARGITYVIEVVKQGEIKQALLLGLMAAFEFATAAWLSLKLLAINFIVNALIQGLSYAITLPVQMFAALFTGVIDLITALLTGNLDTAFSNSTSKFGDMGVAVVKAMGISAYNSLGQAFEDAVNRLQTSFFRVWQKIDNAIAAAQAKLGRMPTGPGVVIPKKLDVFRPLEGGDPADIIAGANDAVGTAARDAMKAHMDKMFSGANILLPENAAKIPSLDDILGGGSSFSAPAAPSVASAAGSSRGYGGGSDSTAKKTKDIKDQRNALERLVDEWSDLGAQQERVEVNAVQSISGGMTDAISSLLDGTKSATQAFSEMADSIVQDIMKMIIQMQVQAALASVLGGSGATGAGGIGGVLGGLIPTAHTGGTVGKTNLVQSSLPKFHSGGMASSEQVVKVEKGEEILTRRRAGDIKAELAAARGQRNSGGQKGQALTIMNITDRSEVSDAVVAQPAAVVNAISRQLPAVRKMILGGEK